MMLALRGTSLRGLNAPFIAVKKEAFIKRAPIAGFATRKGINLNQADPYDAEVARRAATQSSASRLKDARKLLFRQIVDMKEQWLESTDPSTQSTYFGNYIKLYKIIEEDDKFLSVQRQPRPGSTTTIRFHKKSEDITDDPDNAGLEDLDDPDYREPKRIRTDSDDGVDDEEMEEDEMEPELPLNEEKKQAVFRTFDVMIQYKNSDKKWILECKGNLNNQFEVVRTVVTARGFEALEQSIEGENLSYLSAIDEETSDRMAEMLDHLDINPSTAKMCNWFLTVDEYKRDLKFLDQMTDFLQVKAKKKTVKPENEERD